MIKRWKEFLLEEVLYKKNSRGDIIEGSKEDLKDILTKYAPWYDPNCETPLYRSVMTGTIDKSDFTYKIIDPKKFVRRPPTTENYYNIIIDNSENWKKYPKRSRSIMTHTDKDKTEQYGNKIFRVIPLKENSKCTSVQNDYWKAFSLASWKFDNILTDSLNDFNKSIKNTFNITSKNPSMSNLKKLLSSNNLNKNSTSYLKNTRLAKKIEKEYGSIYEWIEKKIFVPEHSDVELFNYNNKTKFEDYVPGIRNEGYEVWTDEKCLLIDESLFE